MTTPTEFITFAKQLLDLARPILLQNYALLVEKARHAGLEDSDLLTWKKENKTDIVTKLFLYSLPPFC